MFVFYDTETTGLDKDFSQILQIALVFTDDDLNILSSKKMECRRSPWVVPSPGALLTTGFIPDDLKNGKHSHYEMMTEVEGWIRSQHWPVIFAGYNTLGFDEPVLAQNLSQNLLDHRLTTAGNDHNDQSNGRFDIMVLVKAASVYMPGALKLDELNEYGSPSLALVSVARQNGVAFQEQDAHDAMNDIKATVALARVIRKAAPQLWAQMTDMATADGVERFVVAHGLFTFSSVAAGKTRSVVTTRVADRGGDSALVMFDLSIDPAPYMSMTVEELAAVLQQKKDGPFIVARKDSQPILMKMEDSESVIPQGYDEALFTARAGMMRADMEFQERLSAAAQIANAPRTSRAESFSQTARPLLPEQQMDSPVSGNVQERLSRWMDEFHATESWKEAARLLDDFQARFAAELQGDPTLRRFVKFAGRIVYEHAPEELSGEKQDQMKRHIAARLLNPDPRAPYMTIGRARKELEQIEQERAAGKARWKNVTDTQIRSLKLYYTALEKEFAPWAPQAAPPPAAAVPQDAPPPPPPPSSGGGNGPAA